MKIVSWNILSSLWVYKSNSEYKNIPNNDLDSHGRIKKIVNYLLKYTPDVILLQEVDLHDYDYLKAHLSTNGYFISKLVQHSKRHWKRYIHEDHVYEPNGNIIAVKRNGNNNRMHIYRVKLSSNGNYCAVLHIKNIGWFASVHLDDLSKQLRNKQITTLIKWLNKRLDKRVDTQEDVVIGGDFNARPDEYVHVILYKNGFYVPKMLNSSVKHSYVFNPIGLYDYIYVKNTKITKKSTTKTKTQTKTMEIDNKMINRTNNVSNNVETIKKYGSDHYPVIATI